MIFDMVSLSIVSSNSKIISTVLHFSRSSSDSNLKKDFNAAKTSMIWVLFESNNTLCRIGEGSFPVSPVVQLFKYL